MAVVMNAAGKSLFCMLGVMHRDKSNREVVYEWLNKMGPDVVTVELSLYGLSFRKRMGPLLKRRVESFLEQKGNVGRKALSGLTTFIDLPGEYEAALHYCDEHEAPLYLVDMDYFSSLKLRHVEELFSEENMQRLVETDESGKEGYEKVMAKLFFESGVEADRYTQEMLVRDRYMSHRIEVLMRHRRDKKFVHITGWQHMKDPWGIFSHFNPVKVFPYD